MTDLTFIFDGDGVAIHPWRFRDFLESHHNISPEVTRSFFLGPFQKCMQGTAELKTELEPYLEQWGWTSGYDQFLDTWLTLENAPNHELLEVVASLKQKGYSCHLGSNQDKSRARYIEKEMGFSKIFDRCFFSTDLKAIKPQREFYESITQQLEVNPKNIVFFDDSPKYVAAAQEFGWQAHHTTQTSDTLAVVASLRL